MSTPLLIARTLEKELYLLPAMANRHGLITGATGTGKTVTLQKLAESLSEIGVPVFMADVKGDLTGVAQEGTASEKLLERLKNIGITDWTPHGNPVVVWDIFGEKGHPVRATVSDLGPLLLSRLLHLPLSLLLFGLLAKLFPRALSVGAQWDASPLLAVRMPPDVMLILFAMAALACGALPVPRYLRRR